MKSFEGSLRNLNFSPSTSILLNFFFHLQILHFFFLSLKLQYCRTIVCQKNVSFLKKPLFQKRRWSWHFSPRKTPVAQKHRAISRQEKMAFSTPRRVVLGLPSPSPRVGRTYADVTTKISRIDMIPDLLSNSASLAGIARGLSYNHWATRDQFCFIHIVCRSDAFKPHHCTITWFTCDIPLVYWWDLWGPNCPVW